MNHKSNRTGGLLGREDLRSRGAVDVDSQGVEEIPVSGGLVCSDGNASGVLELLAEGRAGLALAGTPLSEDVARGRPVRSG